MYWQSSTSLDVRCCVGIGGDGGGQGGGGGGGTVGPASSTYAGGKGEFYISQLFGGVGF